MTRGRGIAGRLLLAQVIVLLVAGATLAITMLLLARGLFSYHLQRAGETSPLVLQHANEAFEITMAIALGVAALVSLITAVGLLWLLAQRISRPVEHLAAAAESIADGNLAVVVPADGFGRELTTLARSFQRMADRLRATDTARAQMLADLAHEIRTPLATLTAHIEGLEDGIVPPNPETFAVMRAQLDRLSRLVGDIRLAAAAQEHALHLQLQSEPVGPMLWAACEAAQAGYAAKGVTLACHTCRPDVAVHADADRIGQVLANLLANALRHTPAGGRVDVTSTRESGHVAITVSDTGEGIPPDQLEAVFDRFHRVDPSRSGHDGGSGLGLTIARAIAVDHGATLTADSRGADLGTRMTLRLPVE